MVGFTASILFQCHCHNLMKHSNIQKVTVSVLSDMSLRPQTNQNMLNFKAIEGQGGMF